MTTTNNTLTTTTTNCNDCGVFPQEIDGLCKKCFKEVMEDAPQEPMTDQVVDEMARYYGEYDSLEDIGLSREFVREKFNLDYGVLLNQLMESMQKYVDENQNADWYEILEAGLYFLNDPK